MKMIIESYLMYKIPLSIIIGLSIIIVLIIIYFVIKTTLKNRTKDVEKSDDESIYEKLDSLSASKNKTSCNRKIIDEILEKDYESILTNLKSESLCFYKLLAIKANIENQINSDKILEKSVGKIFGVLIAFMIGVVTTVFLGSYSGTIGALISEIVKNEKKDKLNNDSINELTQSVNNIYTKINFDERINFWLFIAFFIYLLVLVAITISNNQYKFDNRVNVLLDLVNYAIEFRKEEILKSKNTENIVPKESSKNEPIEEKKTALENLGSQLLDTESTNKLLNELDDIMEYNTIKNEISNFESSQLYSLKANLKNSLGRGKYGYTIIFQFLGLIASFFTGLIVKDSSKIIQGIILLMICASFVFLTKEIVTDKSDVKKIFLLEIVKEEIESKKT